MFFATQDNYTYTTGGFDILLNALGSDSSGRDYTQCYTVAGAKFYVYINDKEHDIQILRRVLTNDAEGLPDTLLDTVYAREYDIQCYPTHFTSQDAVYVYAAIPRSESADQVATVVYPKQKIDLFGCIEVKNDAGETVEQQIGNPDYYYIDLGGRITSSYDAPRRFDPKFRQGAINGIIIGDAAAITRGNGQVTKEDLEREIRELREYVDSTLFFERYPMGEPYPETVTDPATGDQTPKLEHAKDQEGRPLYWTDAEQKEQTTDFTDFPVLSPVINDNTAIRLKPKFLGLFSEGWMSAYGVNPFSGGSGGGSGSGSGSGEGGGGSIANVSILREWIGYDATDNDLVLSAKLGMELNENIKKIDNSVSVSLANFDERLKAFGIAIENAGERLIFVSSGSGNVVSQIVKSGSTVTFTKGIKISDWALAATKPAYSFSEITGTISASQLPTMYWANLAVTPNANTATTPTFGSVIIGGAKITWDDNKKCLKVDKGFASDSFISAYGISTDSGATTNYNRLDKWADYADTKATWVLSAKLGYDLYTAINTTIATSLADFDERLRAMGIAIENAGEKLSFVVSGSGNAVTSIVKSGTTVTYTKGTTFQEYISDLSTIRSNAATAYGWGNHASGGYVKATALSTWSGTANITTLGTITTGVWHGSKIANEYLQNNKMTLWGNEVELGKSTNGAITIKNANGKAITLSVTTDGYLEVSGGLYSKSFISAYGLNASAQSGGADVASQTWGDSTYTASKAAPANLTASKVNDLVSRVVTLEGRKMVTTWDELTTKPTKKQLNDILGIADWALAASKPTYKYDDLTVKPTSAQIQALVGNYVITFGSKTGAITLLNGQNDNGKINLTMTNNRLDANINGLKSLAFKDSLGWTEVTGKPTFATVATSGKYSDLSGVPTKLSQFTDDVVSGHYLPLTGGTLTGDLRLKDSTDYGRALYFGDGDYCYLMEAADDRLTIFADKGVLVGGTSSLSKRLYFGDTSHYIELNANGFHFSHGVYSDSFISAYGNGSVGGGHLYLDGAKASSSTGNTTQIVFREGSTQQVAISSNSKMLAINPTTTGTNGQVLLGVDGAKSAFRGTGGLWVKSFLDIGDDYDADHSAYKLYVNGNSYVNGTLYINGTAVSTSDIQLKNVHENVDVSISEIANSPCFKFDYKNDELGLLHIGSSAQYWNDILPDAVQKDADGWLTLDYTAVTFASVVALAKQSESHEGRIKRLEDENRELRNKIVELEKVI